MREQFNAMKARWENEKNSIGKVQKLREEIEHMGGEIAEAERNYDLNRAAELKYGSCRSFQKELAEQEKIAEEAKSDSTLLRDKVTEEEIAASSPAGRYSGFQTDGRRARETVASGVTRSTSASSVRMRRSKRSARPSCAAVPASRTRTGRSARSSSWPDGRWQDRVGHRRWRRLV